MQAQQQPHVEIVGEGMFSLVRAGYTTAGKGICGFDLSTAGHVTQTPPAVGLHILFLLIRCVEMRLCTRCKQRKKLILTYLTLH